MILHLMSRFFLVPPIHNHHPNKPQKFFCSCWGLKKSMLCILIMVLLLMNCSCRASALLVHHHHGYRYGSLSTKGRHWQFHKLTRKSLDGEDLTCFILYCIQFIHRLSVPWSLFLSHFLNLFVCCDETTMVFFITL